MKRIFTLIILAGAIAMLGSFSSRMSGGKAVSPYGDSVRAAPQIRQDNDFLAESKSDPYAYEFTKEGDYRFIIMEVYTPPFDFLNLCLDGSAINLKFEDQRIITPEVKNEFRCITGLRQNFASNEYVVKGIKAGALLKAWPSNPATILTRAGIHCTNNKFNCNLYGPQAEWENDGYKFKVMVLKYMH